MDQGGEMPPEYFMTARDRYPERFQQLLRMVIDEYGGDEQVMSDVLVALLHGPLAPVAVLFDDLSWEMACHRAEAAITVQLNQAPASPERPDDQR